MNEDITRTIEWGIRTWTHAGPGDVELRDKHSAALIGFANTASRSPMLVELVWRTVDTGPWREEGTGDQWGVRYTWADRPCQEVEPSHDRSRGDAERSIRVYQGSAATTLVTRSITYGEWTIEQTAQPGSHRAMPVYRPAQAMPKWLTAAFWSNLLSRPSASGS